MSKLKPTLKTLLGATALTAAASVAQADIVHLDDVIIDGSACIGFDCVNGESFGFDTLRLKENNLRIKAQDTSTSASFPTTDWQITFNETSNGGANKFSIDDITGGRTPFTIEANAPSHSLFVDDGGRLGLGTSTPVADVHVKSGNTPTLRLDQDGTSGFTPQIFDVAANEANFFIRDATNGSTLPFRIQPGAPSNALYIENTGDIGLGTTSPEEALHIVNTTLGDNTDIRLEANNNGTGSGEWELAVRGTDGDFAINDNGTAGAEFVFRGPTHATPGLHITGSFVSAGTTLNVPDYVFADDYKLMPLTELKSFISENSHLPNIPSAKEINSSHLDITQMQLRLLEKVEELTLYTLQQHETIEGLQQEIRTLRQ